MDPLSVAASVIALVQAGTGIAKAAKVLRGFTKARAEFCDFLNEITTLQRVVHDVQSSLSHLPQQKSELPTAETTSLNLIVAQLQDTTKELSELSDKLLAGSKGRGKDGLHRISKLQWQRSKAEIARLRDKTRSARESLSICFSALQVGQGMELRGLVETFSSTHEQRHAESAATAERQQTMLVDTLSSTLERMYESAIQRGNEELLVSMQQMLCETLQVHERQRSLLLPPSRHGTGHADSRQTWMNPPYSPTLSLQTSVPQRCWLQCRCRCHSHKRSNMQTPRWLQPIMGAFIVNYNSIPILDPRSCNVNSCHSGRSSFSLVYYFPKWVIARGIHVTTSWSSLTGAGASLHLHVPIVIDDNHDIWVYIRMNDVNYLRGCIERRNIPSSAVDSYGEPLLLRAIRYRSWQACGLLFTSGYNTSLRDHYGATPYSAAIYRLQLQRFLRPKPRLGPDDNAPDSILSRIAGIASDELIHSTPLHDSILNLNTLPLDKSLAADPTAMDDWDEAGITPLIWAIATENEAAVRFLISNGANIEKTDAFGDAPLTQACWMNGDVGLRVAQALLEAGCDPNVRSSDGSTPIFRSSSYAMTKLLLASGADSNIINSDGWSVLSYLACGVTLLDDLDDYPKVITTLIAAGADINGTDVDGNALINWTVGKYNHSHESDGYRFKYLHQQGAKLDVISQYQQTILHFASSYGQLEVVEYIRSIELAGVDPDKDDVWSYTATDNLARVSDQTIRTRAWERRPTRAELLSIKALLVETRERNWEQSLFLYSREDPVLLDGHLQQKSEVEELWQEYLDFCQSASRDDEATEDEGSSIGDGDQVASRNENLNNGEIDEDADSESLPDEEEDDAGSGNDDENDESDNEDCDNDDSDNDSDGFDNGFDNDYPPWPSGEFEIATPHWLREETMSNTKTSGSSDNGSAAEEDSRGELGAVGRSREESDDEDEVFFDANQGEE